HPVIVEFQVEVPLGQVMIEKDLAEPRVLDRGGSAELHFFERQILDGRKAEAEMGGGRPAPVGSIDADLLRKAQPGIAQQHWSIRSRTSVVPCAHDDLGWLAGAGDLSSPCLEGEVAIPAATEIRHELGLIEGGAAIDAPHRRQWPEIMDAEAGGRELAA